MVVAAQQYRFTDTLWLITGHHRALCATSDASFQPATVVSGSGKNLCCQQPAVAARSAAKSDAGIVSRQSLDVPLLIKQAPYPYQRLLHRPNDHRGPPARIHRVVTTGLSVSSA